MTCSLFHVKGHNKRSFHLRRSDGVCSTVGEQRSIPTSNVEEPSSSKKGRGRPHKSTNIESEPVAKRGRGRPKNTNARGDSPTIIAPPTTTRTTRATTSESASRASPRTTVPLTTSRTPTHEASASVNVVGVLSRYRNGRGRGRGLGSEGRDQNTNVHQRKLLLPGKERVLKTQLIFKRPRVTIMGVFQTKNSLKNLYPGLPSSTTLAGPKRVLRSSTVTGDVVFKPTSGLKLKGNQAITTRRLQQIRY
ncbi:hypothetical protein EJD97_001817 [Solanum chilense]|uniref:Uncharacterized protein n=1 Tax=Solanum chilense TaxID=4083 RepID=A0A6N2CBV8_SOLCI|nr:hypothetical protein EJD97_001817 [Solanum chilense]